MVSLWWEEVDSYKSESERACTHSEASSTETGGSESTIICGREVDSLGVG